MRSARRSSIRRFAPLAPAACGAALSAISCGASIQAVYEGDVRFEHCMALDSRPDAKPTIRRACWEEWVNFYTFGQTRDRIDYALMRQKQLSGASDFDEADLGTSSKPSGPSAVPDPTSAFAPPPMMLATDGGAPEAGLSEEDERAAARAQCNADCQQGLDACRKGCKNAPCEKACSGRYKRCATRCEQRDVRKKP